MFAIRGFCPYVGPGVVLLPGGDKSSSSLHAQTLLKPFFGSIGRMSPEEKNPKEAQVAVGEEEEGTGQTRTSVFVYGTLKRGFGNEWLMKEMMAEGRAAYRGKGRSKERYPLVIGPYQVPFLLNMPGFGERVWGEIYSVDGVALQQLDRLEGTSQGHYARQLVAVLRDGTETEAEAWAYFAGSTYAADMWTKTGPRHCVPLYSKQHALSYVKRTDRPPNLSFLQHIQIFLTAAAPQSCRS